MDVGKLLIIKEIRTSTINLKTKDRKNFKKIKLGGKIQNDIYLSTVGFIKTNSSFRNSGAVDVFKRLGVNLINSNFL